MQHRVNDYVPIKGLNRLGNKELEQYMNSSARCPIEECDGSLEPVAGDPARVTCTKCRHSENS